MIQINYLVTTTSHPNATGKVFNTAVVEQITLLQLTEIIKKTLK